MFTRGAIVLMALALFTGACGSGSGRETAIKDLTDQGFSEQAAECLIDELDASDLSVSELTGATMSAEGQRVVQSALQKCASAEDLGNLLQDVSLDDEAVRDQFVASMVTGAGGTLDRAQAECITDYIIERDVSLAELSQAALDEKLPPRLQDMITAAVGVCVPT